VDFAVVRLAFVGLLSRESLAIFKGVFVPRKADRFYSSSSGLKDSSYYLKITGG
jgi:hypothetical protein